MQQLFLFPNLVKIQRNQIIRPIALQVVYVKHLNNSEYDQEIPQSQTADNSVAPRRRAAQPYKTPGRQIKQSNQLSLPHQDDCNTRTDTKQRTTKHRTITDSHNGSNNKQKVNNNRTITLEWTAA